MNSNDRIFLNMIENFNEDELKSLINDLDTDGSVEIPQESLNKIKEKTLNKVDNSSENTIKSKLKKHSISSKKKLYIAAAICFLLLLPFSGKVIADIKKAFKYAPGTNQIIENEQDTNMYILQDTIKVFTKNGYVELLSVTIDDDKKVIYLSARGEEKNIGNIPSFNVEDFKSSVKLNNEKIIKFNSGSVGSGGDTDSFHWECNFSTDSKNNKDISYNPGQKIEIQLKIPNDGIVNIPVILKKAINYKEYSELGPTCEKNGISITAIPNWMDNKLKINLLTSKSKNFYIESYGANPNYENQECDYIGILNQPITLTDSKGKSYKISAPENYAPPLSEFYINIDKNNKAYYNLNIPYIMIRHNVNIRHSFTLPNFGKKITFNNEVISLKDNYKFKVLSLERSKKNEVIIEVDTDYDENKLDSIFNIHLGSDHTKLFGKPDYNNWSCDYFEGTNKKAIGNLKKWTIELNHPNSSKLNLYIEGFSTIKKGPWVIPIDTNKVIK